MILFSRYCLFIIFFFYIIYVTQCNLFFFEWISFDILVLKNITREEKKNMVTTKQRKIPVKLTYIEFVSGFELEHNFQGILLLRKNEQIYFNVWWKKILFSITKQTRLLQLFNRYCFKFSTKLKRDIVYGIERMKNLFFMTKFSILRVIETVIKSINF